MTFGQFKYGVVHADCAVYVLLLLHFALTPNLVVRSILADAHDLQTTHFLYHPARSLYPLVGPCQCDCLGVDSYIPTSVFLPILRLRFTHSLVPWQHLHQPVVVVASPTLLSSNFQPGHYLARNLLRNTLTSCKIYKSHEGRLFKPARPTHY